MRITTFFFASLFAAQIVLAQKKYKADWDDLNRYPQAEWLNELKFGMYWHWNYNSVAGNSGWYGRQMYDGPDGWNYKYHVKTYGDPSQFGYKDFEPLFTAKKFSAKQWVGDAERIGCKFIVGMAVHHDGFDMYKSSYTPWNSVDKLPHIDVIGELAKEARKKGMKFGATSHLAWNWNYFSTYMYPDKYDAKAAPELYNIHDPSKGVSMQFAQEWYKRTTELIDNYKLDFLWFDFGTMDKTYVEHFNARLVAHYYNRSLEWHKTVALATKVGFENRKSQVHDVEHGKFGYIRYPQWMADCTMNKGWFYLGKDVKEDPLRISGKYWTHQLIDIVSKNGTLLLNLGPKADGSWNETWKTELFKMGDWLRINGEAIYGSKPWHRYGEGPTHEGDAEHYNLGGLLTKNDIRFTKNNHALYAIVCGKSEGQIDIVSLGKHDIGKLDITQITMLGSHQNVSWKQNEEALRIALPNETPHDFAYVLKIEGKGLFPKRAQEYLPFEIPLGVENVKEIRISIPGKQKQLALAEVIAINEKVVGKPKYNLVTKAKISLSSVEGDKVATLIQDGNMNGHESLKSVGQTKVTDNPWCSIVFDDSYNVNTVELFAGMHGVKQLIAEGLVEAFDVQGNLLYQKEMKEIIHELKKKDSYVGLPGI